MIKRLKTVGNCFCDFTEILLERKVKPMLKLYDSGVYLLNGREIVTDVAEAAGKAGKPVTRFDPQSTRAT